MTLWSGRRIAVWARAAGFTDSEVPLATAVAWAASEGADHYVSNLGLTVASERRGLWALRVDEVGDCDPCELWNPAIAAKVARALYLASGSTWTFHPVAVSGAADRALPLIEALLRAPKTVVTDNPSATVHNMIRRTQSLRTQIAQTARKR
jgi:Lysozyme like domain